MAKIKHITAKQILNGIGNPCIETTVVLNDGAFGVASCSTGTSIGSYEAVTLYDRDTSQFQGLGVLKAAESIETVIAPKLIGMEATKQQAIDRAMIDMDGTQNKSRLGGNTMLSISIAVAKAAAASSVLPLYLYLREFISKGTTTVKIPLPLFNLFNGGAGTPGYLDFQDFLLVPATSLSYTDCLQMGSKVYTSLRDALHASGFSTLVTNQGGFSPQMATNSDAFGFIAQVLETNGLRLGFDVFLGVDAAATQFYKNQQYKITDKEAALNAKNLTQFYQDLVKQYHVLYLEDPLSEDDWAGWSDAASKLAQDTVVVGGDLIATNPYRLQMAIDKRTVTGIVIKPNQIGTVIEALAVVEVARAAGLKITVSERSNETNDDFIADFSVAVGADYVKCGAPSRGEHVSKYNRLLQIENQIKLL